MKALHEKSAGIVIVVAICACYILPLNLIPFPVSTTCSYPGVNNPPYQRTAAIDPSFFGVNMAYQPELNESGLVGANMSRLFCFWWCMLEPANNTWNFTIADAYVNESVARHLTVFGLLICPPSWVSPNTDITNQTLPAWLQYVNITVRRYMNHVKAWEIWNEPDQQIYWSGTFEQFCYVQKTTAELINAISPSLTVISAAAAFNDPSYLDQMITYTGATDFNSLFDAVAVHMYYRRDIEHIRTTLSQIETTLYVQHAFNGTLWITEIGYPTIGPYSDMQAYEQDLHEQADELVKTFAMTAADPHVETTVWFYMWDPEGLGADWQTFPNFGLFYGSDHVMKPSGFAYRLMSSKLSGGHCFPEGMTVTSIGSILSSQNCYFYCIRTASNETFLILWNNAASCDITLSINQPAVSALDQYSPYDGVVLPVNYSRTTDGITFRTTIDNTPRILGIRTILGEPAHVSITISPTIEQVLGWDILPLVGFLAITHFLTKLRQFKKSSPANQDRGTDGPTTTEVPLV